jgi:hypothetical protein
MRRMVRKVQGLTPADKDAHEYACSQVHMEENKRLAAELELLRAELKKANEWRLKAEGLQVCCECVHHYVGHWL